MIPCVVTGRVRPSIIVVLGMKMTINTLYIAFVNEVILWYKTVNHISSNEVFNTRNDLSKLKLLKIFFLFYSKSGQDLSKFDLKFLAMQYGPVEEGFYNFIKGTVFGGDFQINNYKTIINSEPSSLDDAVVSSVKKIMTSLFHENEDLVNMRAFDLVDLTHAWNSWKLNYQPGQKKEINSLEILNDANRFYAF